MQKNDPFILWLVSWYPNKLSPYEGDFIQRHAQAVSTFIPVHVLYLVRDSNKVVTDSVYIDKKQTGNLTETIIYYSITRSPFDFSDKFFSTRKFHSLYRKYISELFQKKGLARLVHVHIAFKAGLIAKWVQKKYKIPFFLTEHWTIYLQEAKPNISDLNFLKQRIISNTVANARKIFTVSDYLGKAIQKKWPSVTYKVVPNVVNSDVFFSGERFTDDVFRLIHISGLNYQKDPENLFKAVGILKRKGIKFSLEIFGVNNEAVRPYLLKEGIEQEVSIHPEVPQEILSENLRKSHALILYSRYETFGCVIIEANACGIPVVVSDTALMRELVKDNFNGVLVNPGSAESLAEALMNLFHNKTQFNTAQIAESVEQYSYERVGKMFYEEYLPFLSSPLAL
ncbi:MAG: glycosyltransferase [Bacteroidia bacterium]|nr:glycosyltransferase [Bacteroidia bacterium]